MEEILIIHLIQMEEILIIQLLIFKYKMGGSILVSGFAKRIPKLNFVKRSSPGKPIFAIPRLLALRNTTHNSVCVRHGAVSN